MKTENVKIIDCVMGSGKTSAAINYIRRSGDEKILFITPFLSEIEDRVIPQCPDKNFVTPTNANGTKLKNIRKLLSQGCNVASTHALFRKFTKEILDICRVYNYTLILDEVVDVVENYGLSYLDAEDLLTNYVDVDEETRRIMWRDSMSGYVGKFTDEKHLCGLNSLFLYGNKIFMYMIPPEVFTAFNKVIVMTYMFSGQVQRYYFEFNNIPYEYWGVKHDIDGSLVFCPREESEEPKVNYRKLINIVSKEKLNRIGEQEGSLSSSWYNRNSHNVVMQQLKRNIYNFFFNIADSKTECNMWTTFSYFKSQLKGKGYTKGFVAVNSRATNAHAHRNVVAYPVNRYLNPVIKNFFGVRGIDVDEDAFALSEMLQFIWRSAIRNGEPITLYIPSARMRELLIKWIDENSCDVSCDA